MNSDSNDVDKQILDAAQEEFAQRGFHDTAVSSIADRAGVGKGTIYRHFGKKNRLFAALIRRATDTLTESIEQVYDDEEQPEQQIRGIYRAHVDMFETARPLVALIVNEGLDKTGDMKSEVIDHWEGYEELVSRVFRRGVKENKFRQTTPDKLTRLFTSWIWGMLRSSIIFSESNPKSRFGDIHIDMFLKGLAEDS